MALPKHQAGGRPLARGWIEFAALGDAAGISESVLSKQSRVLEDAGCVEVRKGAAGRLTDLNNILENRT